MKDSLGGNAKTTLIVTCSPHESHISETLSTLRFGESAQKIKNKPKINRELTTEELQRIIERLEATLEEKNKWIKILEGFIKDMGSELPAMPAKSPKNMHRTQSQLTMSTANLHGDKFISSEPFIDDTDEYEFNER